MRLAKPDQYIVYYDSESSIHSSKNSGFHSKSKHINVICYWLRDVSDAKSLEIAKIHTGKNISNTLTKVVTKEKHKVVMVWAWTLFLMLSRFFMESEREGLLGVPPLMKKQQKLNNFTCLRKGARMHCARAQVAKHAC